MADLGVNVHTNVTVLRQGKSAAKKTNLKRTCEKDMKIFLLPFWKENIQIRSSESLDVEQILGASFCMVRTSKCFENDFPQMKCDKIFTKTIRDFDFAFFFFKWLIGSLAFE